MSDTIMAEKIKPQEKVAFASRKYSNEDRIKREEEELATLVAEQKGESSTEEQAEAEQKHAESNSGSFFLNAASAPNTNTLGIYGSAVGQNPVATRDFQRDIFGF